MTRYLRRELTRLLDMFRVLGRGQVPVLLLCWFGFMGGAVPEAEAVVSGFKDVAMMGQAIE